MISGPGLSPPPRPRVSVGSAPGLGCLQVELVGVFLPSQPQYCQVFKQVGIPACGPTPARPLSCWLFKSLLSWNFLVCSFILSSTTTSTGPHTAPLSSVFHPATRCRHTHCTYTYRLLFLANALKRQVASLRAEVAPGIELWLYKVTLHMLPNLCLNLLFCKMWSTAPFAQEHCTIKCVRK